MDLRTCRFCLESDLLEDDEFLAPCACAGSLQHVHRSCLARWRDVAVDPLHRLRCQICKIPYRIPRKWPIEVFPMHGFVWRYFLSNSVLMALLAQYFHLQLLAIVMPSAPRLILDLNALAFTINNPLGILMYNVVLIAITSVYCGYYYDCFQDVQNKRQYLYYGSIDLAKQVGILAGCLYLTQTCALPFGGFYIAFLANSMGVHYDILQTVNTRGAG
jgi:hypothetical protein